MTAGERASGLNGGTAASVERVGEPRTGLLEAGVGGRLVAALERTWEDVRIRHSELPAAVFIIGSGTMGMPRDVVRLGHFGAHRWQGQDGRDMAEIFVAGEGLPRGAASVLATVLHEGAHFLAQVRGIQDTSRGGRYHNQEFRRLGQLMGLELVYSKERGWSDTVLPEQTAAAYSATIAALQRELTVARVAEAAGAAGGGKAAAKPKRLGCVCACQPPRRILVVASVLERAPIRCEACGEPFGPA